MEVRFGTPVARGVIAATVLGSGIAFLDSTVVNVALPAIAEDFDSNVSSLQWTVDAYLVTLTALLLFGGSVGDIYGRRKTFIGGLIGFTLASVACAAAPNVAVLAVGRALQGVGGAFLVPGSLAIIGATFAPDQRSRAIGTWSGLGGVASALGPFVGGYLVDSVSWRFVFFINVPLAIVALWVTTKYVPETRSPVHVPPDVIGAVLASIGLALSCWGLIEQQPVATVLGLLTLAMFVIVEGRREHPMLPLTLFQNPQFTGANLTTLAVYAALGGAFFFLVIELQLGLGYSALEAGASLLPVTAMMLLLSARAGALAQRIGPRLPMTIGPIVVAVGMLLFTRVEPGASYFTSVLPAALVFGLGLATTVAPLTSTVLAAADESDLGIASGVNNAVARLAGLLAVAVLPTAVGLETTLPPGELTDKVHTALIWSAAVAAVGGVVAFLTVRTGRTVQPTIQVAVNQPCADPCRAADRDADAA
jgi:EmrB/QacA subfamily drug resistance transporter